MPKIYKNKNVSKKVKLKRLNPDRIIPGEKIGELGLLGARVDIIFRDDKKSAYFFNVILQYDVEASLYRAILDVFKPSDLKIMKEVESAATLSFQKDDIKSINFYDQTPKYFQGRLIPTRKNPLILLK